MRALRRLGIRHGKAICSHFVIAATVALSATAEAAPVRIGNFESHGVELTKDKVGFRLALPRASWQDAAKETLTDRAFMALSPVDFHDGVIEADVMGELDHDAPTFARAFVGIAFRIGDGKFENIYLRPTNGVADDQVRRNHSVQYFSFPDYPFDRLRRESPERYETAADIAPGRWTHMKIEVAGDKARLFLDHRVTPSLIVNDLKLGAAQHGAVGIWIETATVAHFRRLRITSPSGAPCACG
jgi:hypothetical protein